MVEVARFQGLFAVQISKKNAKKYFDCGNILLVTLTKLLIVGIFFEMFECKRA